MTLGKKMKRCLIILAVTLAAAVLSLFPTWSFDRRVRIGRTENPLWDKSLKPRETPLIRALQDAGLRFHTDRGAEADPDGVCFGEFGSDEYWVVQYDPESHEVDAYSWITGINWIGHVAAERRFARIREILREHLGT